MSNVVNFGIGITLADHFTRRLGKAQKGVVSFTTKLAAISTVSAGVGSKMLASFGDFTEKFAKVAQKQGDIMSLGMDTTGMEGITQKALAFSSKWSKMTTEEFIGASYDIKSGIASLGDTAVGEMTRLSGVTAKATKSNIDTMTSLFSTGYSIYSKQFYKFGASTIKGWKALSQEEKDIKFGEYFSVGISSSVTNFKTDGAKMANAISTLGATATTANVSLAEQLNIMGMLQATMGGSDSATKYKAFLNAAGSAGKKLGLNFRDSNKNLLAMPLILDKLKKKFGKTLDDVEKKKIKDAFGTDEALALITLLYDKNEDLKKGINDTNNLLSKGGIDYTKKMAQAREYGQEYGKLSNQFENFGYIIGKQLAPAMSWLSEKLGGFINKVVSFTSKHEKMAQIIATGAVAFAGIATVLGTVGIAVAGISLAFGPLGAMFSMLMIGLSPLVLAVGVLAGAVYLLIDNWELVRTFWGGLWDDMTDKVSSAWDDITGTFDAVVEKIKAPFIPFFEWTERKFAKLSEFVKSFDIGQKFDAIGKSVSDTAKGVWDSVSNFAVNMTGGNATLQVPSTVSKATNSTVIQEGDSTFHFNIKGDNPEEIARKVKAMIDAQNRDKKQRSIE